MEIDIGTRQINEIDTRHAVTLVLSGGATVRIECPFRLAAPADAAAAIDPEDFPAERGLVSTLLGREIEAATAEEETGLLSITIRGGLAITVPPDPDFEAWSIVWSDGSMLVALPGGGLSAWGA